MAGTMRPERESIADWDMSYGRNPWLEQVEAVRSIADWDMSYGRNGLDSLTLSVAIIRMPPNKPKPKSM